MAGQPHLDGQMGYLPFSTPPGGNCVPRSGGEKLFLREGRTRRMAETIDIRLYIIYTLRVERTRLI